MALKAIEINLSELDTMDLALQSNIQLEPQITVTIERHQAVNVSEAMKKLENVGKILRWTYAYSKGFPCSTNILEIMCNYQTMIKNSFFTILSFEDSCLSALKYHRLAIAFAENGKIKNSLTWIQKCSALAKTLAQKSGDMADEAKNLHILSTNALIKAQNDESISRKEKEIITKRMNELTANQREHQAKTTMLHEQIKEAKEKQEKIAQQADKERGREFALQMVSTLLSPLNIFGNNRADWYRFVPDGQLKSQIEALEKEKQEINKKLVEVQTKMKANNEPTDQKNLEIEESKLKGEIQEIQEKIKQIVYANQSGGGRTRVSHAALLLEQEMLIMKFKTDLQAIEMNANAAIEKIGELLKGSKIEEDGLTNSIHSLELVICALGKIQTTFSNTKMFWLGVASKCENLMGNTFLNDLNNNSGDDNSGEDPFITKEIIKELKNSGMNWLVLGKINYTARSSIKAVDEAADKMMNNLPTKSEAIQYLENKDEFEKILKSIQDETSIIF